MLLIENAIAAIQVGVEDYHTGEKKRLLSAVRNIYSGILLLAKEKLRRLSPADNKDILIYSQIVPVQTDAGIRFEARKKNTVNYHEMQNRFKSLGVVFNWEQLNEVKDLRCDVEHFYPQINKDAISGIIAKAVVIIRDLCVDVLSEDPLQLFGDQCWEEMLRVKELYDKEKKLFIDSYSRIDIANKVFLENALCDIHCEECSSDLVEIIDIICEPILQLRCKSCGNEFSSSIESVIENSLAFESYIAATDGADDPLGICPECQKNTYVYSECECVICGYKIEYTSCASCHAALSIEEQDNNGLCSYCKHLLDKDD